MNLGADWWKLVCVSGADGQASVYYSDPNKYRAVVETALALAAGLVLIYPSAVLGVMAGGAVAALFGPLASAIGILGIHGGFLAGIASGFGAAEALNMLSEEQTWDDLSNYWRFDLETVDDGQIVSIALHPNMTMEFQSKSGHESTRLSNITHEAFKEVASSVDEAYDKLRAFEKPSELESTSGHESTRPSNTTNEAFKKVASEVYEAYHKLRAFEKPSESESTSGHESTRLSNTTNEALEVASEVYKSLLDFSNWFKSCPGSDSSNWLKLICEI